MLKTNIPTKIPQPFAYNAGASYKNTIPTASQISIANGRASLNDGFPPNTFLPLTTGGVPPFGADVNGILNEITSITQWQQAGGFFVYDSTFSTTIGGYPKGAILQSADSKGLWVSSSDSNTTNPDTGGADWVSLVFEGTQEITVTTANVTVSQLQAGYPVLIISGALTAARSLIMPAIVGEWIIQNNTTGAFNLTVKTASGTGVTATQSQSTFLYGDGTNILFADSSKVASFNTRTGTVTLNATDVTTALGYTPVGPNLTGAVTSVGNASSLGSFTSLQLATALTDETGTGSNVFASSPTFTGIPAAPTAASGTNTTQIATTAFANPGSSIAGNGYQILPSGLILQWGNATTTIGGGGGVVTVTYPIAFPAGNTLSLTGSAVGNAGYNGGQVQFNLAGGTTFTAYTNTAPVLFFWLAIGF